MLWGRGGRITIARRQQPCKTCRVRHAVQGHSSDELAEPPAAPRQPRRTGSAAFSHPLLYLAPRSSTVICSQISMSTLRLQMTRCYTAPGHLQPRGWWGFGGIGAAVVGYIRELRGYHQCGWVRDRPVFAIHVSSILFFACLGFSVIQSVYPYKETDPLVIKKPLGWQPVSTAPRRELGWWPVKCSLT